jgi:hypothetical protein
MLAETFRPPAARKPDTQRKAREETKRLAALVGCDIEKCGGGWNVWPPKADSRGQPHPGTVTDPFEGDHYAQDWEEALVIASHYAKAGGFK